MIYFSFAILLLLLFAKYQFCIFGKTTADFTQYELVKHD